MCIVVDRRISLKCGSEGNADGFQWPEGSSPERVKASVRDTTGV
jgi:hypothetical protein